MKKFSEIVWRFCVVIWVLYTLSFVSCSAQSKNVSTDRFIEEGFEKATVKNLNNEKGCEWILVLEKEEKVLIPLPLENRFLKEGLQVWIKYHLSRRPQGTCVQGTTIVVDEIKIKE